jgi:hypothetical protein
MLFNVILCGVIGLITTVFIRENLKRGYRLSKVLAICAGAFVILWVGVLE